MELRYPSAGPPWLRDFGASVIRLFKGLMDVPFRLWPVASADLPAAADYSGGLAWNLTVSRVIYSDGAAWQQLQPYDATLAALAAFNTNGIIVQTAADSFAGRTLAAPAAGLTIANPAGIAGNPTFALANDLAALEALGGTNTLYYRSGADTWSAVTIGGNLGFSAGTLGASLGTAATRNTGSSGTTVPLLDGTNTWANAQTFSANPVVAGGGVAFPATQVPSANANTLDDYEEGTWTPGLAFVGGSTGITYGAANGGNYVKIGQLVFVSGYLQLTSKGSSTGLAILTGLPFASAVTGAASPSLGIYANMTTITGALFLDMSNAATQAFIYTTPVTALSNTNFNNNTTIEFAFSYRATA